MRRTQPYFDMNPKLNADTTGNQGSKAGTVNSGTTSPSALALRNDRLYASVDEFLFQVPSSSGTAGSSRTLNPPQGSGTITPSLVDETRFFLTANSRAPDVNLFNQPRVIAWPISSSTSSAVTHRIDQTIAFCGAINCFRWQSVSLLFPADAE